VDVIFCSGGNKSFARIALAEGFRYGLRSDYVPYWKPYMVDINWKSYDWKEYLDKLTRWQPVMAMIPDYEAPEQQGSIVARAMQLVAMGIERVMVCPKFAGAIFDIPDWCVVAVSVPSRYSGYLPSIKELAGRRVHLLGGSPRDQGDLIRYYGGHGIDVMSVDVNMHLKAAMHGTFYSGRKWRNLGAGAMTSEDAFRLSCQGIIRALALANDAVHKTRKARGIGN